MNTCVMVHNASVLERVQGELSEFLSRRSQYEAQTAGELLGIWLDPVLAADPGPYLGDRADQLCVREAVGRPGLWLACFLESPDGRAVTRADLLSALISSASFRARENDAGGCLIPVYSQTADRSGILADLECLSARAGQYLGEPWLQDAQRHLWPSSGHSPTSKTP